MKTYRYTGGVLTLAKKTKFFNIELFIISKNVWIMFLNIIISMKIDSASHYFMVIHHIDIDMKLLCKLCLITIQIQKLFNIQCNCLRLAI